MAELPRDLAANPVLARWVRVGADGRIDVRVGKVELGQGILTALAQLAADELDAELADVRMQGADTVEGPDEGVTAGSLSISTCGPALRVAAANVRALFVQAAGRRWRVDPSTVTVHSGRFEGPEGQHSSYGRLAELVDLEVPADPSVPARGTARFAGTDVPRLDLPDKIAGRPRYVHDLRLPGQWFARVIRPPSRGARLAELDPAVAGDRVRLVRDGSFVAVAGPDEAEVLRAAERVRTKTVWSEVDTLPDEDDLDTFLRAGPHETIAVVDDGGDVAPAGPAVRATYSRPFLAHASMAPSCAVARWNPDGRIEVWSHSQGIGPLGEAIATALGLDPATVHVRHAEGAGCYGHNAADDAAFDAVLVARAVPGTPVQVLWSRQDELGWAPFSSAMVADVTAALGRDGRIAGWRYDVYSQGHSARPGYAGGVPGLLAATTLAVPAAYPAAVDPPAARGAGSTRNALPGYDLPDRRVTGHRLTGTPIRSSAMRSLGGHFNVFAIESMMDEAAAAAGADPLEFRLAHLSDERGRRVLRLAADAAGWGRARPEGTALGLGYARYKGTGAWCAVVAEIEAETDIRVPRLWLATDVGEPVNPDGVRNQIEGGAVQATSWTLLERVRFDRRQVTSTTWESYPILPFSAVPDVVVALAPGDGNPSVGAGEAAQGPTAAAIGNALAAAVGVRVRDLPLTPEAVMAAIEGTP
jgi:nicotinate dehydrogenase subunit B